MRYQPVNRYRDPCRVRLDTVLTVCEILVCLALLALFVVLFAKALTDDDPFYRTDTDAHYQRIAALCPNLNGQDQIDCYTWLRKGGRHE